jgi:hypothetical protein
MVFEPINPLKIGMKVGKFYGGAKIYTRLSFWVPEESPVPFLVSWGDPESNSRGPWDFGI